MMRFAHVTGILFSDREGYRFEVSLDDRRTVVAVRDERIPDLLDEKRCAGSVVDRRSAHPGDDRHYSGGTGMGSRI